MNPEPVFPQASSVRRGPDWIGVTLHRERPEAKTVQGIGREPQIAITITHEVVADLVFSPTSAYQLAASLFERLQEMGLLEKFQGVKP